MHMKGKLGKNSHWFIWLIIGLGIGITIGRLFDWGYFVLSKEISVPDALNIFITIALTLYVANVLEKRLKREQFKSELYVDKICEIEQHLQKIEILVQEKNVQYQQINTLVHIIGIAKNSLIESIPEFDKESVDSVSNALKSKQRELKSLLTDRPIDKKDKSVIIRNNTVVYSSERIAEIITAIYSIKEEYFKLKILLNE